MVKLAEKPVTAGTNRSRAEDIDRDVGQRVRERRMMLGLTTREVAELIGVTYSQAQKYEAGINRISAGKLYGIAQALGVDINYFFEQSLSEEQVSAATSQQRMLLELARHFVGISTRKHREAILALARALATLEPAGGKTARTRASGPSAPETFLMLAANVVNLPTLRSQGETVGLSQVVPAVELTDGGPDQPRTSKRTAPAKFIERLMGTWALGRAEVMKLLGFEQEDDFLKLMSGTASLRTRDLKDRVRHLIRMREALHSLFRDLDAEREWLREPRPELDNQSPLALLLEGSIENFLVVSQFVQRMAGR